MRENEDIESFDELEDLDALEADDLENLTEPETDLLEYPCVKTLLRSYEKSSLPCVFLDKNLLFLWGNLRYNSIFPESIDHTSFMNLYRRSLDEKMIQDLVKQIRSKDTGFSWRGKMVHRSNLHPTVIANLVFTPIFPFLETSADADPLGFVCLFDDVTEETRELLRNTFKSLLEASKLKDNDTGNHIERVNSYSRKLAREIGNDKKFPDINQEFIDDIGFLAAMHDVGKIGTPDDILNKNGPLEKWEWDIMKEHTVNGAYLLSTHPKHMAKDIALFHHERWDGKGYPYGLSENMAPLSARIVAIADVYDALRSKRSYKAPMSHEEACSIIEKEAGTHFDPMLVEVFAGVKKDFNGIYGKMADLTEQ